MLWFSLAVVTALSVAYRVYVNRGQTWGTPDEKRYSMYAHSWRPGRAFGEAIEAFLNKEALEIPPTRYGFFALCAFVNRSRREWTQCFRPLTWIAAIFGAVATPVAFAITKDLPSSLLVASSPLSLFLSRRALQDTYTTVFLLGALLGVRLVNPWLFGASIALALASREAVLLYLPALAAAWWFQTHDWYQGAVALVFGVTGYVAAFYALGGRKLFQVFKKLRQPTDYVKRFQSGMPHRVLVDLLLVSPVVVVGFLMTWALVPLWLSSFLALSLVTHAFVTPKNARFLLVVDLGLRMACAWLPGPWRWVALGACSVADFFLYRAIGKVEDPITSNLVLKQGMGT